MEVDTRQIINLTDWVLKKGMGFVPTTKYNPFDWIKNLNLFIWKVKWKKQRDTLGVEETELPANGINKFILQ